MTPVLKSAPPLTREKLREELAPFYPESSEPLIEGLLLYLDLLLKWNERTNLTSIREPIEIVRRHFGESLFAAQHLPPAAGTLLDLGSGAGFPGLPIQLARPELAVTLAESQGKKAAFLREAVRVLGLGTEVWGRRAELLPASRRFDVVALRAVDQPEAALATARTLLALGGSILHLTSGAPNGEGAFAVPGSERRILAIMHL